MCMTLEITYFRDELVQLNVSRSDLEQEVQRYSMKKNTLAVDSIMLQDELWMRQREKPSPNRWSRFFENRTAQTEFSVSEFWDRFDSVFRKPISEIFIGFRTPILMKILLSGVMTFGKWYIQGLCKQKLQFLENQTEAEPKLKNS